MDHFPLDMIISMVMHFASPYRPYGPYLVLQPLCLYRVYPKTPNMVTKLFWIQSMIQFCFAYNSSNRPVQTIYKRLEFSCSIYCSHWMPKMTNNFQNLYRKNYSDIKWKQWFEMKELKREYVKIDRKLLFFELITNC